MIITGETPSPLELLDAGFDRWERQMWTAFPAKVLKFSETDHTVEVEPGFKEVFVTGDGRQPHKLAPIPNVPVAFPRASGYTLYMPPEPGDHVLVVCTKYSLDRWRQTGRQTDPGDLRRFSLDGAVAILGLFPDTAPANGAEGQSTPMLVVPPGEEFWLGGPLASSYIALADKVNAELIKIKQAFDAHVHTAGTSPGDTGPAKMSTPPVPGVTIPWDRYPVDSDQIKST